MASRSAIGPNACRSCFSDGGRRPTRRFAASSTRARATTSATSGGTSTRRRYPLLFLETANQFRFKFKRTKDRRPRTEPANPARDGAFRVSTEVWVIAYEEKEAGTMIKTDGHKDLPAQGRFWIEPATGRVLMSELVASNRKLRATIDVSYQSEPLARPAGADRDARVVRQYEDAIAHRGSRDLRQVPAVSGQHGRDVLDQTVKAEKVRHYRPSSARPRGAPCPRDRRGRDISRSAWSTFRSRCFRRPTPARPSASTSCTASARRASSRSAGARTASARCRTPTSSRGSSSRRGATSSSTKRTSRRCASTRPASSTSRSSPTTRRSIRSTSSDPTTWRRTARWRAMRSPSSARA